MPPTSPPAAWERRLGLGLAGAVLVPILALTLLPLNIRKPPQTDSAWGLTLSDGLATVDIVLNLILFLPLGAGLGLARQRLRRVAWMCAALTLAIEAAQWQLIPNRDPSLRDALTNLLGGILGWSLGRHWRAWVLPKPGQAAALGLAATAVWLGSSILCGWLLAPALPGGLCYSQWAPELGGFDVFRGRLMEAKVGGVPAPAGPIEPSDAFRARLLAQPLAIEVLAEPAGPTLKVAPIFSVFNAAQEDVFLLCQDGWDLVLHLRLRSSDARLHNPALRLEDVFGPDLPGPVLVRAGLGPQGYVVQTVSAKGLDEGQLRFSTQWPWFHFKPFSSAVSESSARIWTAAWMAAVLLPIGYCLRRMRGGSRRVTLAAAVMLATATSVPLLERFAFGFDFLQPWMWLAAAAGFAAGWWGAAAAEMMRATKSEVRERQF